jgi:hypothetical protein
MGNPRGQLLKKQVCECIQRWFIESLMDFSRFKIANKIDISYYLIVSKPDKFKEF